MHEPLRFYLDGGFKYFLFSPLFGEDSEFDYHFSDGLKPPTSYGWKMKFAGLKYFFFWGDMFIGVTVFNIKDSANRTLRRGEANFDVIWCCFMGTCQWSCLTQRACIFAQ